jgi:hypothetical protein
MYKKITHTIVEEHFDHPIASQIKKSLGRSKIVTNEVFLEDKFRADIHSYFESYINHLVALVNSVNGPQNNFLLEFDNFFKTPWLDDLGNMIKPIYPTEFAEKINEALRMMPTTIFSGLQLIQDGKDTGPTFNRMQFITNELAQTLSTFNNAWQYGTTSNLFNTLFTDVFNLAKARIAKNSTLEQQLLQKISTSWTTFEKVFVDGVIRQYPERFTKTATTIPMTSNSRDIM